MITLAIGELSERIRKEIIAVPSNLLRCNQSLPFPVSELDRFSVARYTHSVQRGASQETPHLGRRWAAGMFGPRTCVVDR